MDDQAWGSLYRVLASLQVPAPDVPVAIHDSAGERIGMAPLGWPRIKLAIVFDHTERSALEAADWTAVVLDSSLSRVLPQALRFFDDVHFNYVLRVSEASAEMSTSSQEQVLLEALVRAGLPMPNRNLRLYRDDNSTLTVPDFAWEDRKLAVFLDGAYWHGGKNLDDLLKSAVAGGALDKGKRKAVQDRFEVKQDRDARNRRELTARGWTVIACSALEVDAGPDSVAELVQSVLQSYRNLTPRALAPE